MSVGQLSPLQRLSLYLLTKRVARWEDGLRDSASLTAYPARSATGVEGTLYVQGRRSKSPSWIQFVGPKVRRGDELSALANASTGAVLMVACEQRHFAFTFGQGRWLLEPDCWEHDFGLRVVLNLVRSDRLKSVDARTIDEVTLHTRRDISLESAFADFGLDVTRDLVSAVAGQPAKEGLVERVAGSDRLAVWTRSSFEQLPDLCKEILRAYRSRGYRQRFPWVDQFRPVKEAAKLETLDGQVVTALQRGGDELQNLHLAPPEPMDWDRLPAYCFSTQGSDPTLETDPRVTVYRESLDDPGSLTLENLRRHQVRAMDAESDDLIRQWSVYKCLVYEARSGTNLYVLTGGTWYRISTSFFDRTVEFVNGLPNLDVELPAAEEGMREDAYNEAAAEATGTLCLDQKTVSAAGRDRIEICDLLSKERQLIHVKRRGSSSMLSHLFSQGVVSAELLLSDESFRERARERVAREGGGFEQIMPTERPDPSKWEVSFVVVTRSTRETPLTLPFFSLVNLVSAARRLRNLGFRVSTLKVDEG